MDIPKATESQIDAEPELDPVLAPSGSVPWFTFTGKPGESASAFILCVQRIAFRQGRDRDDAWLADYASTCFDDEALYWYLEQDEESKGSWRKLRSSLLSRYPATSANMSTHPATSSLFTSAPSGSRLTTGPTGSTGQIEVVGHYTEPLGYLSFDQSGATITADQTQALRVTLPIAQSHPILQICMTGPHAESLFPYLGLALISSSSGDQNCVLDPLKGVSLRPYDHYSNWYPWEESSAGTSWDRLSYVPLPSSKCQNYEAYRSPRPDGFSFSQAEIATWILSSCKKSRTAALYRRKSDTEIPGQRGAAAVWKYNDQTEELRMYWVMDDDSECEVGAYVHRDTSDQIHVHRLIDMEPQKLGPYPGEDRVRLVFRHVH